MSIKRPQFVNREIYHLFNRGVEKRDIFLDDKDYLRFIHDLYEFNDEEIVMNTSFYFNFANYREQIPIVRPKPKERKLLVDILCFSLMPNHWHLLLRQLKNRGISLFLQKLGGYATYFNKKYERVGPLFQGRFKAILVKEEAYFIHLSRYIHLQPVELIEPNWKEKGIVDWKRVNKFLKSYRWSSYLDFIGKKNFPSVINKDLLNQFFDDPKDYEKFVNKWIVKDLDRISNLSLE